MLPATVRALWLHATVFITGAAVMVIELLGTRLIAPFYGSSLYVWTSVIAVTLIALALGYYLGGRWADRARRTGLALIVALGGLLTLLIPGLTGPVLLATDPLGLRWGSFVATLILFTPSLLMLGMVGPFAVKMSTQSLEGVGGSTGSIYAVSTVGSVIGTLFLGFYLFPLVGTREIFIGVGLLLLVLAAIVAWCERAHVPLRQSTALLALIGLGCLGAMPFLDRSAPPPEDAQFQTRFEQESLHGWVRVVDDNTRFFRFLMADASVIGAANLSTGQNVLSYQNIVSLFPAMAPGMRRALLIGQGAGHMAMTLSQWGVVTDTIELDPAVASAATQFFGFQPSGEALVGDARYEIRRLQEQYDLIIMDVFTGGAEPVHLLTVETLRQLEGMLSDTGLLAFNFVSFFDAGANPALASVSRTLAEVFPQQQVFMSSPGQEFNDFIFLASRQPLRTAGLYPDQQQWLDTHRVALDLREGRVLTDNFNPLEKLQLRKSEHYRRFIADLVGPDRMVR